MYYVYIVHTWEVYYSFVMKVCILPCPHCRCFVYIQWRNFKCVLRHMEDRFYLHKVLRFFQETAVKSQGEDLNVNSLLMHYWSLNLWHNQCKHGVCFSKLISNLKLLNNSYSHFCQTQFLVLVYIHSSLMPLILMPTKLVVIKF